ncbi:PAS domain-containing protein [Natrialbaceae archaeon GCM10025810]|uniref:PAS domain-containing protein n=1 Tax=Halovalidus salilacus TaxID=3075124 RepID=UPI00360D0C6E
MGSSSRGGQQTRVRQQAVVTELSQRALTANDLDELLNDAATAVAETLGAERCGVFELLPNGEVRLDAGIGWEGASVGTATAPVNPRSWEQLARSPEGVVRADADGRLIDRESLTGCDLESGIEALVGPVDDPRGILGVYATERREFDGADANFVRGVANILASAIENERARTELEEIYGRISDAFFALDEEWRFTHINERAHELINPEGRELVGERIWEAFPKAVSREFQRKYERAMYEQETVSFEEYYPEPLDAWFEVRAYPSETGLSVYFRDVTERRRRERDLERTERRFEAIFEDPNILVGLLEPDGTVLDINETAMEYIDADLEAVTGEPFWETPWWGVGEEVRSDVKRWTERAASGEYVDFEADLERPDGERYTLNGVFRPVTNDEGDVVSVIVSDRDVTERTRRERELEESERRYRTLVEHFPNGAVALVDEDLRYQTVGGSPLDVADVSAEEVEEKPVREAIPTALADELVPRYEAALEEGESNAFQKTSNGRIYEFHVVPVRDDDGEVFAALGMSQDVTEPREYQRQLEESERRYRTLAEHFPNGLVTLFDENLEYTLAAGKAFEYLPVDPSDVEGRSVREAWGEAAADRLEPAVEAALDGEERSVEFGYAGREWIVHAVPITHEEGDVFAGMTMAQDITERKEHERYLRDAKSQLEAATEAGAVGTWEWDVETDEFVAGTSFARTFGVDPEAAQEGVSIDRFVSAIHPADRDRVEEKIEEAVEAGREYEAEYRVRNHEGEIRWVVARGRVETDEDGEPTTFPGAVTDITDRKRAELELQRNTEQLETLFEILPVGVIVADADGRLVEANETAKGIWGGDVFDADSVSEYDRYSARWVDSDEPVAPEEWTLARVLEGEEVTDPDVFEIDSDDGDRRIIRVEGMPVRNARGEVTRGVVTLTDITERRQYQRKLAESERRYRTLVESFPEGAVCMYDENLEYTVAGGQLLGDVGVEAENRVGNSVYDLYPDPLVEEVEPYFHAALEGETNAFEVEFHDRYLSAHTLPVRDADDEIIAGMLVVQDVTERREYQRKLEQSNERLEQFAYAASHDLQEPLRMVTSYLQLLERRYDEVFDEDGEEFLEFAIDGADRMRAMIDGLLEYSRVETQGDPFEPLEMNEVVDDVLEDLQLRIEESDAEITVEDLPRVEGDPDQIRQVMQNLLSNAITYSGDETPRVHVGAERRGRRWVLSVRDEGIGIDPEDTERVFTVFDRLHSRDEYEGTGIGLALCQRIVERHGGDIWVDSDPGEGSTFSFTLPAA